MKIALHSVTYSGTFGGEAAPVEDVVSKAAEFGYDGLEIIAKRPHASPIDLNQDGRKRLRDLIASKGLELVCLAGYQDFSWNGQFGDMAHHEKELLYLIETIRLAHDLGCHLVRSFSGYLHPDVAFQQQWNWCVKYLREAAAFARDMDVVIGIQNHGGVTVHHLDVLDMVKEINSEYVKIQFDAPFILMTHSDYREAVHAVKDYIAYSVVGAHKLRPMAVFTPPDGLKVPSIYELQRFWTVPLGEQDEDYPAFISALKEVGYDGWLGYEICGKLSTGMTVKAFDEAVKAGLAYLRALTA
jgi:sugar phosphate isomerase/epimerase